MKKPQSFSCEVEDWEALDVIAKKFKMSRNAIIQHAVGLILKTGEIEPSKIETEGSIESQIKAAQLKKLENQNSMHNILRRKAEASTKILEYHAKHVDVIGHKPSSTAYRAMEQHENPTLPYDKEAIYCPDCKWFTDSKTSVSWQIDRLTDHVRNEHHRNFTDDEAKIIAELMV